MHHAPPWLIPLVAVVFCASGIYGYLTPVHRPDATRECPSSDGNVGLFFFGLGEGGKELGYSFAHLGVREWGPKFLGALTFGYFVGHAARFTQDAGAVCSGLRSEREKLLHPPPMNFACKVKDLLADRCKD